MSNDLKAFLAAMAMMALIAILVSCNDVPGQQLSDTGAPVSYFHDDAHAVSCWLYGGTGNYGKAISCLPDTVVKR